MTVMTVFAAHEVHEGEWTTSRRSPGPSGYGEDFPHETDAVNTIGSIRQDEIVGLPNRVSRCKERGTLEDPFSFLDAVAGIVVREHIAGPVKRQLILKAVLPNNTVVV